eukprot:7312342-Prymnesium_polylepis.2
MEYHCVTLTVSTPVGVAHTYTPRAAPPGPEDEGGPNLTISHDKCQTAPGTWTAARGRCVRPDPAP